MFNIFQYEKVNRNRRMHESLEVKQLRDKKLHTSRTNSMSTQANLRRLEWAAKYLNSDFINGIF